VDAGAKLIVTPGTPLRLAEALVDAPIPVMPGCATPSEAMTLAELGFEALKFFPAVASGGAAWLKAIAGPLPGLTFCPTGGIDLSTAPSFLALPNVPCVGGTWMAPAKAIADGDFETIGRLAREAAALRR
jgi:2-dehydro-3-deoxyphosphogluconate aldolase/(4S)-4-hydroxy-2-oxoglutarate aldolase